MAQWVFRLQSYHNLAYLRAKVPVRTRLESGCDADKIRSMKIHGYSDVRTHCSVYRINLLIAFHIINLFSAIKPLPNHGDSYETEDPAGGHGCGH